MKNVTDSVIKGAYSTPPFVDFYDFLQFLNKKGFNLEKTIFAQQTLKADLHKNDYRFNSGVHTNNEHQLPVTVIYIDHYEQNVGKIPPVEDVVKALLHDSVERALEVEEFDKEADVADIFLDNLPLRCPNEYEDLKILTYDHTRKSFYNYVTGISNSHVVNIKLADILGNTLSNLGPDNTDPNRRQIGKPLQYMTLFEKSEFAFPSLISEVFLALEDLKNYYEEKNKKPFVKPEIRPDLRAIYS